MAATRPASPRPATPSGLMTLLSLRTPNCKRGIAKSTLSSFGVSLVLVAAKISPHSRALPAPDRRHATFDL